MLRVKLANLACVRQPSDHLCVSEAALLVRVDTLKMGVTISLEASRWSIDPRDGLF